MRVLIVRVGAMGDVLHALPGVTALRRAHPDWRIDWAIEPRWQDLLVAGGSDGPGPVVDEVIPVRTRDWKRWGLARATVRDVLALRRRLRAGRYDVCVDLQGSVRSAVIGWMAGARRFAGSAEPRERPAGWLYGERVATSAVHVVQQGCEVLGGAVGETLRHGQVELPVDAGAERWFRGLGVEAGRFVVVAPGAGWGAKAWPAERFGEVAARLAAAGWPVLVNGGPGEQERAEAVVRASGGAARVVACSLAELTAAVRRAALVVGGDTGPMHLADALGVPVVALFGPTDPARTGPSRPEGRRRVLRHASSRTDHRRHPEAEAGLLAIDVEVVFEACLEMLRGGAGE